MLPAAKNQGLFNLSQANQVMMAGFPAPSIIAVRIDNAQMPCSPRPYDELPRVS